MVNAVRSSLMVAVSVSSFATSVMIEAATLEVVLGTRFPALMIFLLKRIHSWMIAVVG